MSDEYRANAELNCRVRAVSYNFALRSGIVETDPNEFVDLARAVQLFSKLDSDVRYIAVFGSGELRIAYAKLAGHWSVIMPARGVN
jgi:hypothetical protein